MHWTSATQMIGWATRPELPSGGWEPRASTPFDSTERAARSTARSVILAAVDHCRPPVRAWLRFAYAAEASSMDVLTLMIHLVRVDTPGRLAEAALVDYRDRVRGRGAMGPRALAMTMGMSLRDWKRRFKPAYEALIDTLAAWDDEGLQRVEQEAWRFGYRDPDSHRRADHANPMSILCTRA
jgi:hypothetical protein